MPETRGFTLVELMITIALVAIMTSLAGPALQTLLQNNRAAALANNLISSIRLARSEAVNRAQTVTMCPSTDGVTCVNTTDWANGWVIRNTAALIRTYPAITQTAAGSTLTGSRSTLVFESTGFQTGADFTFNLTIPNCRLDNNRRVVVTPQGRPGVEKIQC